ncbi:MAG: hypothetical protein H0T89_01010 [Deltaproteobacteria bacterium]|nr:hypothetical protein [Deltaproteobacteria bacterium]
MAEREQIEAKLRALGLHMHPAQATSVDPATGERWTGYVGVRGFRDKQGGILSADFDFVARATAFFNVTTEQLAATMYPDDCSNDCALKMACTNIRQMKAELRRRKIRVR